MCTDHLPRHVVVNFLDPDDGRGGACIGRFNVLLNALGWKLFSVFLLAFLGLLFTLKLSNLRYLLRLLLTLSISYNRASFVSWLVSIAKFNSRSSMSSVSFLGVGIYFWSTSDMCNAELILPTSSAFLAFYVAPLWILRIPLIYSYCIYFWLSSWVASFSRLVSFCSISAKNF